MTSLILFPIDFPFWRLTAPSPKMLVEPRPMAIAMAFLACLYLGFFLKSQSKEDGQVSDLRESLHHYVSGVLPWVSDKYDTSEPPPQIDLVNEEESPAQMTTTPITGAAAKTSPSQPTSPAVSHADDLESSSHIELPHLQELCRKTEWTPNLWLHCHSGCGASKNDFCGGLSMYLFSNIFGLERRRGWGGGGSR